VDRWDFNPGLGFPQMELKVKVTIPRSGLRMNNAKELCLIFSKVRDCRKTPQTHLHLIEQQKNNKTGHL